jgi:hypothetical protein
VLAAPGTDPACNVTAELAERDRLEQAAEMLRVPVARGQQDDLALRVDDPGGAGADAGVGHRDVQGAGRVGGVELARVAAVDQRRAVLDELQGALRGERVQLDGFGRWIAVELDDALEVRRLRLELVGQALDKLVLPEA